jgi:hypothetical protein
VKNTRNAGSKQYSIDVGYPFCWKFKTYNIFLEAKESGEWGDDAPSDYCPSTSMFPLGDTPLLVIIACSADARAGAAAAATTTASSVVAGTASGAAEDSGGGADADAAA